jgi:hypothetical protein
MERPERLERASVLKLTPLAYVHDHVFPPGTRLFSDPRPRQFSGSRPPPESQPASRLVPILNEARVGKIGTSFSIDRKEKTCLPDAIGYIKRHLHGRHQGYGPS